jgi:hypothetical protein
MDRADGMKAKQLTPDPGPPSSGTRRPLEPPTPPAGSERNSRSVRGPPQRLTPRATTPQPGHRTTIDDNTSANTSRRARSHQSHGQHLNGLRWGLYRSVGGGRAQSWMNMWWCAKLAVASGMKPL